MKKSKFSKLISKYSLGGSNDNVIVQVNEDGMASCDFIGADKGHRGRVEVTDFETGPVRIGVGDTDSLSKILSILDEEITAKAHENKGKVYKIGFSDSNIDAQFVSRDVEHIPDINVTNPIKALPDVTFSFEITKDFINTFVKSNNAIKNCAFFTLVLDSNNLDLIFNKNDEINTNNIKFSITIEGLDEAETRSFEYTYKVDIVTKILNVNKDFTAGVCSVRVKDSDVSLMDISFVGDDFCSRYLIPSVTKN
jgi:hypothetical protein